MFRRKLFVCLVNAVGECQADGNDCSDAIYHCSPKFLGRVAGRLHHCSLFFGCLPWYISYSLAGTSSKKTSSKDLLR